MDYKSIAPHVLTKKFSSGTMVEYLCKECGVLCKKQATSLYLQTKDRIATNDRRLYWCIDCTKNSSEFLSKVSENAKASNKKRHENRTELNEWQLKLKKWCPDITPQTDQLESIEYICDGCSNRYKTTPKSLLRSLRNNVPMFCRACAMKEKWKDSEYKAKRIASINEQFTKPEYKEKHRQNNIKKWENPEFRAIFSSDEMNKKKSDAMKEKWQNDEEYKNRVLNSFTEERRNKTSEKMKQISSKERMSEMGKASALKKLESNANYMETAKNNLHSNLEFINFIGSSQMVAKCKNGHDITIRLENYMYDCYECSKTILRARHPRHEQNTLRDSLKEFNPQNIHIGRKEIDIYLPDSKIGIEYCGQYWHCDINKQPEEHKEKYKLCVNSGIYLITLYESEWLNNNVPVINYIKSFMKPMENKEFIMKEISAFTAISFLSANSPHVENFDKCYGIFTDTDSLKQVVCLLKNQIVQYVKCENIQDDVKIIIASLDTVDLNLDNRFIDYYWFKENFVSINEIEPNYKWCKREILYNSYDDISEKHRQSNSLGKIYDCGRTIYSYSNHSINPKVKLIPIFR